MNGHTWSWSRAAAVVFVAATSVVLIVIVIRWAPQWLASTKGLRPAERTAEVGRVRTALLATLAGSITVVGAYYTSRTFALNRQGQITERFTRAVDQLGSEQIDVRLGGIYALERLSRESPNDYGPIFEILTAYVRERAPWPPVVAAPSSTVAGASWRPFRHPVVLFLFDRTRRRSQDHRAENAVPSASGDGGQHNGSKPATDIQAVLTVVGRRQTPNVTIPLDLSFVALSGATVPGAVRRGKGLLPIRGRANLAYANLTRTHLEGAGLSWANLQRADLTATHLEGADLTWADLTSACLPGVYLEGAKLGWADLQNAHLRQANLKHAHLSFTRLQHADLVGAQLDGADLTHLEGADLTGAYLDVADFKGGPRYNATTVWPDGFDPSSHGAVLIR